MYELKVTTHFSAAHRLAMVGEKCENLHGHNWKVEAYVSGDELNDAGVLMDFGVVKKYVRGLMETLDHKYLNELPHLFDKGIPSSELIAKYIADSLQEMIDTPGIRVSKVSAWESETSCATYIP